MQNEKPFDALDMLQELDAGLFVRKMSRALSDAALAVVAQDGKAKKARVTVEIDITRMAESGNQVMLTHKLAYSRPTRRGKVVEEDTTETPMYVSADGAISMLPFTQIDLFKSDAQPQKA